MDLARVDDLEPITIDLVPSDAPRLVVSPPRSPTFAEVYETQFEELVRLAGMVSGSVAVAEDVVQDAFARLYVRFDSIANPAPYLRQSVLNGCVSRFRKHRYERLVEEHDDGPGGEAEPSERVDLERRLARLTDRQRAVVVMRIHLELSEAEVASILACRPGTVGSLLHRALTTLRIDLDRAR